jgi:hypothetical protein
MGVAAQLEKRATLDALRARFVRMPLAGEGRVRGRGGVRVRAVSAPALPCVFACFRVLGFDRVRALTLRTHATRAPRGAAVQDTHACVLSLLLALARAPLASPLDAPAASAALARADAADASAAARRAAAAGRAPPGAHAPAPALPQHTPARGGEGGHEDTRSEGGRSEADTLSDWSDDGDDADAPVSSSAARAAAAAAASASAAQRQASAGGAAAAAAAARAAAAGDAAAAHATARADAGAASAALAPRPGPPRAITASESRALASALRGIGTTAPTSSSAAAAAASETALARAALRALRGTAPMPPLAAASAPPHLSGGALASALARIGDAAASAASVGRFCDAAAAAEGAACAPLRALAACLDAMMFDAREACLAPLERRAAQLAPRGRGGATLLEVSHAAAALLRAVTPLCALRDATSPPWLLRAAGVRVPVALSAAEAANASSIDAADAAAVDAARCLDGAWRCVLVGDGDGDAARRLYRAGLACFAAAAAPALRGLGGLLGAAGGTLEAADPRGELPLAAGPAAHALDDDPAAFWDRGLVARPSAGASPACLAPLLPALRAAAASRALLRHARGRAAADAERAAGEAGGGAVGLPPLTDARADDRDDVPLHEAFCAALLTALREGPPGSVVPITNEAAAARANEDEWEQNEEEEEEEEAEEEGGVLAPAARRALLQPAWPAAPASHAALTLLPGSSVLLPVTHAHAAADAQALACASSPACVSGAAGRARAAGAAPAAAALSSWLSSPASSASLRARPPPPPDALLERSLLSELRRRAAAASAALLAAARGAWRLDDELSTLRAVFLCDGAPGFAAQLARSGGEEVSASDATSAASAPPALPRWRGAAAALDAALAAWAPHEPPLAPAAGRLAALPASDGPPAEREEAAAAVSEPLAGARVSFRVRWPLGVVVPPSDVARYARALAALLAVKRAAAALDDAAAARWKAARAAPPGAAASSSLAVPRAAQPRSSTGSVSAAAPPRQPRLSCRVPRLSAATSPAAAAAAAALAASAAEARLFVSAYDEHLHTRVLAPATALLAASLAAAADLDGVRAAHAAFLASVCRGTLVAPDALWTLLAPRVRRLLALAPRIAAAAAAPTPAAVAAAAPAAAEFSAALRFVLRLLAAKVRAGGPASQIGDCEGLLARMNFNGHFDASVGAADA